MGLVGSAEDVGRPRLPPPPPEVLLEDVQDASRRRPALTARDALEAVQQAMPDDHFAVVHQLKTLFASRRTPPHEVSLLVFGMFLGRVGMARQLRTRAIIDALHGVPPEDRLTAALTFLEDLSGGLQDNIAL